MNLDNEGQDFTGELYAFIDDGMASSVLFVDNISEVTGPVSKDITFIFTDAGNNFAQPIYTVADGSKVTPTDADIQNMLERAGCTNISRAAGRWNFTYRGMAYYFETIAPKQLWTVKVDGKLVAYMDASGMYDKDTFAAGETYNFSTYSVGTGVLANGGTFSNDYLSYLGLGATWSGRGEYNFSVETGYVEPTITYNVFSTVPGSWSITYSYDGARDVGTQPTALKVGDTLTVTATLLNDWNAATPVKYSDVNAISAICSDNSVITDLGATFVEVKGNVKAGTTISFTYTVKNPTTINITAP